MKKSFSLFLSGWLVLLVGTQAYSQGPRPAKLKIGNLPIVDCLQLFVAQDKGFLAQEGIEPITEVLAGGAAIMAAVAGGSLEAGFTAVDPFILAVDQGFDFLIIADGAYDTKSGPNNSVIVVRKDAGINRPRDMEGKKITINAIKGIGQIYISEMVKADGGDPSKVTLVELPFPQAWPALINKLVDGANLVEPFYTIHGNHPDLKFLVPLFRQVRPGAVVAFWAGSKKWVTANEAMVERFSRALARATDFIQANPQEARVVITRFTRMAPDLAVKIGIKDFGKSANLDHLQWSADKLYEYGWVKKRHDVNTLVYRTAR